MNSPLKLTILCKNLHFLMEWFPQKKICLLCTLGFIVNLLLVLKGEQKSVNMLNIFECVN